MLFLFQSCLGLSFKNWTGLQDLKDLKDRVLGLAGVCSQKLGPNNIFAIIHKQMFSKKYP